MAPSATGIHEYESDYLNHKPLAVSYTCHNGMEAQRNLVKNALKQRVNEIDTDTCEPGEEDAFFVADVGEVYRQHLRWKMNLKRVKPHYGKIQRKLNVIEKLLISCSRQMQLRS